MHSGDGGASSFGVRCSFPLCAGLLQQQPPRMAAGFLSLDRRLAAGT